MKIVVRDSLCRDVFEEYVVAENINEWYGKEFVKLYNNKFCDDESDTYLDLVEDNYVCYNGYELHL